jgi:hypothetical protein
MTRFIRRDLNETLTFELGSHLREIARSSFFMSAHPSSVSPVS